MNFFDGVKIDGNWQADKLHGKCTFRFSDGTKDDCFYINDELQSEADVA